MQNRSSAFEVQTYDGKRWLTESLFDSEQEARGLCTSLLRGGKPGVRILRETTRGEDTRENVIYTEMRAPGKENIRVMEVESAPICERAEDLCNRVSRLTAFRLLRQYFEKVLLTPTEAAMLLPLPERAADAPLSLAEPRGMRPLVAHCHLGLGFVGRSGDPVHQVTLVHPLPPL